MPNTHTTLTSLFSDIADSIRAKTGSSAQIVADDFPDAIDAIPTGGGGTVTEDAINFYDYDGTLVASWTLSELAEATELPANPDHSQDEVPLTSKGWNWTLADLKTLNRQMNVGQMYDTSDGAIHFILDLDEGRLSPVLGIAVNGSAVIDWGDSNTDSISGTTIGVRIDTAHAYASGGRYHGKVTPTSGTTMRISGDTNNGSFFIWSGTSGTRSRKYQALVTELYLPKSLSMVSACLYGLAALEKCVIPCDATSIASRMFFYVYRLPYVTIPSNVTMIDTYSFDNCFSLKTVSLPKAITAFNNSSLTYCYSLGSVTMPPNVTVIGTSAFNGMAVQSELLIPSGVTDIGANAFANCLALARIKFLGTTPPTIANVNAFANLTTDCKILVPTGSLSAYTSATNYPDPSVYTYEEY